MSGARLAGQRIVVTGAASGLGREVAEALGRNGAASLLLVDVDAERLSAAAEVLRRRGAVTVLTAEADVVDRNALVAAVDRFADQEGGLDVMVNNVGVLSPSARVHNVTTEDFQRVLQVNVLGVLHGMQAALAAMRPAGSGSIINTASVSAITAWSHASPYCASKAAVVQLTKVAAVEYAAEGVRVNCVCPGAFRSAIHDGLPDSALAAIASRHPVGRMGTAPEVAEAYVYLADPVNRFTTGSALVVDGGYSAP